MEKASFPFSIYTYKSEQKNSKKNAVKWIENNIIKRNM